MSHLGKEDKPSNKTEFTLIADYLRSGRGVIFFISSSLFDAEPDLVQAFDHAVENIIEFDVVPDQQPAAIRKISFEFEQIFDLPLALVDPSQQSKGRRLYQRVPE